MKVLLAVHHFPPRYSAGAELYTARLARWLLDHGHAAEVVCVEEVDHSRSAFLEARYEPYDGIPVWRLRLGMAGAPFRWSYNHPLISAWVAEHLAQSRPDLLHLHSGYLIGAGVLEAAEGAGVPRVVTLHDYWFLCPRITLLRGDGSLCHEVPQDPAGCAWCVQLEGRRYSLPERVSGGAAGRAWIALAGGQGRDEHAERRAYLQRALAGADLVIAPSQFLARQFAGFLPAGRIRVTSLGIDTAPLRAVPRPTPSGTFRLAYIGQIAPHKGLHVLVAAMGRLKGEGRRVTLTIHGNLGAFPTYVRRLREQIGADERITLAGPFAHERAAAVLGAADAVVVPSLWYENSPLSILEAQAAGRPVVASALGGMAELVRDRVDGLHFRPGDSADLARQIERLRDEPGLLERLAAGARTPPSVDEELHMLYGLYEGLLARRGALLTEAA